MPAERIGGGRALLVRNLRTENGLIDRLLQNFKTVVVVLLVLIILILIMVVLPTHPAGPLRSAPP